MVGTAAAVKAAERFWSKVDVGGPDECWPWLAGFGSAGYGQFSFDHRPVTAHTFGYELQNGPIPPGKIVRHTCDFRPCCNGAHLVAGTRAENSRDMVERGRSTRGRKYPGKMPRGESNGRSKLMETEVGFIRLLASRGHPQSAIGAAFEVSQSAVSSIVLRESWAHI